MGWLQAGFCQTRPIAIPIREGVVGAIVDNSGQAEGAGRQRTRSQEEEWRG
jgi:hypothetical protein